MSSEAPILGLRADGGPGRGVGHLARCLALAQAWRDLGLEVVLATDEIPDDWRVRYGADGIGVGRPGDVAADVWVVDGYDLGADVAGGGPYVRIDDRGATGDGAAALVVDQNLGADPADYLQDRAHLLLGPRYALLRRELVAAAAEPRPTTAQPCLLVAQGGAPAPEVRAFTEAVVAALDLAAVEVVVWTGHDDPVPALRSADAALAAAGSTLWELCLFGVPAVVFTVAPNQVPLAAAMAEAGLAADIGAVPGADPGAVAARLTDLLADAGGRSERAVRLRQVVDGGGAARVAARIRTDLLGPRPA